MSIVIVKMKDGTTRTFPNQGRLGGSYSNTVRYEIGFVVIVDEYSRETAIPSADVTQVSYDPELRGHW